MGWGGGIVQNAVGLDASLAGHLPDPAMSVPKEELSPTAASSCTSMRQHIRVLQVLEQQLPRALGEQRGLQSGPLSSPSLSPSCLPWRLVRALGWSDFDGSCTCLGHFDSSLSEKASERVLDCRSVGRFSSDTRYRNLWFLKCADFLA